MRSLDTDLIISSNKKGSIKVVLFFIIAISLLVLIINYPPTFFLETSKGLGLLFIMKIVVVCFMIILILFIVKSFLSKSPALIIKKDALYNNSTVLSIKDMPVFFKDIIQTRERTKMGMHFFDIIVKNPQEYIDGIKNGYLKKVFINNYKETGAITSIPLHAIKYDKASLMKLIKDNATSFAQ